MNNLDGVYYQLDSMNSYLRDRLFKASAFKNEEVAIDFAENYDAALIKLIYKNNELIKSDVIYDPYN